MSVVRPAATESRPLRRKEHCFGARATLRANPCPEVTDPSCRLPLLTLFYRPEASHLGDLLRSWVRPTARARFALRPTDFQGSSRAHRTPHQWRRSAGPSGLSPVRPLPGPSRDPRQQETTTLAGALADVSVVLSCRRRLLCWLDDVGSGISTRFPFTDARREKRACSV